MKRFLAWVIALAVVALFILGVQLGLNYILDGIMQFSYFKTICVLLVLRALYWASTSGVE